MSAARGNDERKAAVEGWQFFMECSQHSGLKTVVPGVELCEHNKHHSYEPCSI